VRFLFYLLVSWLLNAVVLAIVAWIFTDVQRGTTGQLLAAAAVFGVLNTILKPILKFVTFPLAILTFGLVWFGVSMLMLWITASLVNGFDVEGDFWTYVWATLVIWLLNMAIDAVAYYWLRPHGKSGAAAALAR
jgi:putative membrane protein